MTRIILVYGFIAGVVVVACMALSMALIPHGGVAGMMFGYLSMLIALSMVFAGVKKYRDEQRGGVIGFGPALAVGIGISLIASIFYTLGWEAYLYATGYRFMPDYVASAIAAKRAEGASPADIARFAREMQGYVDAYANPATRMLMTASEIAPVALLVSLIAAALLRLRNFMPARAHRGE